MNRIIILILLLLLPLFLTAQPGGGDPGGDPDVPISGIEILITLGGLFGASRFFRKRKSNEN